MTVTMPERLTDDVMAAMYESDDPSARAAALAEAGRQDRARATRARSTARYSDWESAAYGQYLAAEERTRGNLLSEAGQRRGRDPWPMLWQGNETDARKLASEELLCMWDYESPRVPPPATFAAQSACRPVDEWPEAEPVTVAAPGPRPASPSRTSRADAAQHRAGHAAAGDEGARSEGMGLTESVVRAGAHAARDAARAGEMAAIRQRAARAAQGLPREEPAPVRPGAAGVVAVPEASAPAIWPTSIVSPERPKAAPPDGAKLWLYVRRFLARYVAFRTEAELDLTTAWIFHAVARERDTQGLGPLIWRATPRLLITSQERGSGKSTLLDLILILTRSGRGKIPKLTPAKLAEVLGRHHETVTLDEARTIFGTGSKNLELQGCLLAGYTRRASYEVAGKSLSLFGPVAMAAKLNLITEAVGDAIADLLDRCLTVMLVAADRPMPEVAEQAEEDGDLLAQALIAWTDACRAELKQAARDIANEDQDAGWPPERARTIQIVRPLRACARVAGPAIEAMVTASLGELTQGSAGSEAMDLMDEIERRAAGWGDVAEDEPGRIVMAGDDDEIGA